MMSGDRDRDRCPWTCVQFNEAMQASPPALQVLLRKMAFDLNNLRSDVKTMMAENARNQQERGDKTETESTPRFHGIKIKRYCRRWFQWIRFH